MRPIEEIQAILDNAHGTQNYHKVSTRKSDPIATDGVMSFATAANCFWLLDAIISHQGNKKLDPYLQVWILKAFGDKPKREAVLQYLDNDKNVIIEQKIEYTDFPLDEITLWVMGGGPNGSNVILLPSEY
jgi:hypothetical protein